MFSVLGNLGDGAKWLVTIGAAIAVVAAFLRFVRPGWVNTKMDLRAVRDTLVGRDAVNDSITGEQISPQIPGIGARMAHQEAQMGELAAAMARFTDNSHRLERLEERVTAIEQGHHLERLAGKVESVQLLRTIEQVSKQPPEVQENQPRSE